MLLIDGKKTAQDIRTELAAEVAEAAKTIGRAPGLAVVLVGEDPASQVYVRNKIRACEEVGIVSMPHYLPPDIAQQELEGLVDRLNMDGEVDGILVQLPLPEGLRERALLERIDPGKDVDGFHPQNMGRLAMGLPGFKPCTPWGVCELLRRYNVPTNGARAVIVGRSNIVGKPMALLLQQAPFIKGGAGNATVTICHSRTMDLAEETRRADILIAAIGRPNFFGPDHIKEGATVIDVGMNRDENGKLCGDCDFAAIKDKVHAITPVPGGVGPMTIAMLLSNTVAAFKLHVGLQ